MFGAFVETWFYQVSYFFHLWIITQLQYIINYYGFITFVGINIHELSKTHNFKETHKLMDNGPRDNTWCHRFYYDGHLIAFINSTSKFTKISVQQNIDDATITYIIKTKH